MTSTEQRKIVFKKVAKKPVVAKPEAKEDEVKAPVDSTFILRNLNVSSLDRSYALPEIARKQERETEFMRSSKTSTIDEGDDSRAISTSLEKLGISTTRKDPIETICWGDHYKIQLFVNVGLKRFELTPTRKLLCTWCHLAPPEGALMLAVPYKYVSSYIHEHVYAPECVNIVRGIQVESSKNLVAKKTDPKSAPKINYYRRDLSESDKKAYSATDKRVVTKDYFETAHVVCSFNCMQSKGVDLAEKDPRFKNFRMHMIHLYQRIFGALPGKMISAPHFEVREEYGGDHTVAEYRKNFKFITMDQTNQYYFRAKELMNETSQLFTTIHDD